MIGWPKIILFRGFFKWCVYGLLVCTNWLYSTCLRVCMHKYISWNFMRWWICFWQLKGFEFIKAVHLDPVPFDMERDLITPTYKKKRPQLLKYYQVKVVKFSGFHFCFRNYCCFIIIGMDRMSCLCIATFFSSRIFSFHWAYSWTQM